MLIAQMNRTRAAEAMRLADMTLSEVRRALYLSLAKEWTALADQSDAARVAGGWAE
jgi:hypothetical protein